MTDKAPERKRIITGFLWLVLLMPTFAFGAGSTLSGIAADHLQNGRYLEALSFYRDVEMNLASRPELETAVLYRDLGDIYFDYLADDDRALHYYFKLMEIFPDFSGRAGVCGRIVKALLRMKKKDRALEYLKRLKKIKGAAAYVSQVTAGLKKAVTGDDVGAAVPGSRIRVLVLRAKGAVRVCSQGKMMLLHDNGTLLRRISANTRMVFTAEQGRLTVDQKPLSVPVRLISVEDLPIRVADLEYRGALRVSAAADQVMVVNHLDLEKYLYGVVPREVSPAWPKQALRAQAVAARTYAFYHMLKRAESAYDVFSTTASQVYGGKKSEHPNARSAVDDTRGEILTRNGKALLALYHANSGGQTEAMKNVWNGSVSCLVSVRDEFSRDRPGDVWQKRVDPKFIASRLKAFGLNVGEVGALTPGERSKTGRIKRLEISGESGDVFLSGNSFRLIVGPAGIRSTNFSVAHKNGVFVFSGNGYGHGVGMSQWGACTMAKQGYTYKAILAYYYPGVRVERFLNNNPAKENG